MSHADDPNRQFAIPSEHPPEKLLDRLRTAWQSGERPNLDDFLLQTDGDRLASLLHLVREDLSQRFAHGESPRSEEYFARYPELGEDSAVASDLIAAELSLRRAHGMGSSVDGYLDRFPQFRGLLATQLEGEVAKSAARATIETSTINDEATINHEAAISNEAGINDGATVDWVRGASAADEGEWQPPQIPGYAELKFIARGGMGFVLKARHLALDRLVAIKMPLARYITSDEDRERFLREARNTARLRHPQICAIHEVGEAAGRPYIVMDFIRGETLRDWATRRTPAARQVSEIMAILARAVGYAHEQGVIHRDLKPGNVMIDEDSGEPILMDFGLAKEISDDSQLTQSGQVMGTPDYMAPEQAAGHADKVGPLSDVYSLGAILYAVLCQRPPFSGTLGEVLRQVQTDEPVPPRKINLRIHRDLETVCLKALAKDPARRYSSAIALADDLERFSAARRSLRGAKDWPAGCGAKFAAARLRRWCSWHFWPRVAWRPTLESRPALTGKSRRCSAILRRDWTRTSGRQSICGRRKRYWPNSGRSTKPKPFRPNSACGSGWRRRSTGPFAASDCRTPTRSASSK